MYQIDVKHHYKWPSVSVQLHHNQCLMKQGDSHWAKHCNFMCWNAIILHYVAAQDIVEGERILITHVKFCLQRYLYAWLHHCMYGHPILTFYQKNWVFFLTPPHSLKLIFSVPVPTSEGRGPKLLAPPPGPHPGGKGSNCLLLLLICGDPSCTGTRRRSNPVSW